MKFYRLLSGDVTGIDEGQDIPDGAVEITSEQYAATSVAVDHNSSIRVQIVSLEATITTRRIREAVLGLDNGWLANLNAQIVALRSSL